MSFCFWVHILVSPWPDIPSGPGTSAFFWGHIETWHYCFSELDCINFKLKKNICVCVYVYIYIYIIVARGTVFNILWQNIMEKNMKTNVRNYITDSLCCTEEINTTLFINYACVLSHWVVSESLPTPWIIARQAPLSMGFPRQDYWSGLPCPPPRDLPHPWIKPKFS